MSVGAAGTVVAGGDPVVIAVIAMATAGDIAVVRVPATVRAIDLDNETPTNEICTTTSVIRPDLHRKVRRATPHDQLQAIQDRTTSTLTRVAMSIAEMIRAGGSKDRKVAGMVVTGSRVTNLRNNQARELKTSGQPANHRHNRATAAIRQGISS